MKKLLIHHFDKLTFQYLGSGFAEPCQVKTGDFLMPAFSSAVELPPGVPAGHAAFFDAAADAWAVRPLVQESAADVLPAALTLPERKALLLQAVDLHLEGQAQAMGYSSIQTAVSYAEEDAVPSFQAEGRALRRWRSLVYAACYQQLAAFEAAEIDEPTVESLIEALPAFDVTPQVEAAQ